jgi:hypothetical protein
MRAKRVAMVLGLPDDDARLLLSRARRKFGLRGLVARELAFAVATAPLLRRLLPRRWREAAIRPFVYALIPGPAENLLYAQTAAPGTAAEEAGGR